MKYLIGATLLFTGSMLTAQEISVPNTFNTGDTIEASKMNENFNTLVSAVSNNESAISQLSDTVENLTDAETNANEIISRLEALESINEQATVLALEIARFDGTYTGFGRYITMSSCNGNVDISHSAVSATASINNGSMTLVTHETQHSIADVNQQPAGALTEINVGKNTKTLSVDINGVVSSIADQYISGNVASNGDALMLSAVYTTLESEGCTDGKVFQLSAVKTGN